ncbi:MAG TPA: hypothetical protein VGN15_08645, partial [Ktedonobacteraceae bacterium]|nr:hypothetical protein [Ktedonobacteraceae bacterium]
PGVYSSTETVNLQKKPIWSVNKDGTYRESMGHVADEDGLLYYVNGLTTWGGYWPWAQQGEEGFYADERCALNAAVNITYQEIGKLKERLKDYDDARSRLDEHRNYVASDE